MPTMLPRISTVVERSIYEAVAMLAKKDGVSLSQKARDLLLEALELIEDAGLEAIVERRRKNLGKSIPLAEVKRRFRIK
ncbi:MAG: toxin-antitoxin system, antitoxin component [candidate division NC10 bacterium]|nr:toxin-antitoxin system, antitoxin component [candidate division NC10 bacterium]